MLNRVNFVLDRLISEELKCNRIYRTVIVNSLLSDMFIGTWQKFRL